ncbi:MAG: hypothetical protein M3141_09120, partial [Actinomycetota bacterium]|nr:hypothetical protein [Actinomycetota bacterium]
MEPRRQGHGAPDRRPPGPVHLSRILSSRGWRRRPGPTAVRDARDDEIGRVAGLLADAGFGPTVGGLIDFPRQSPHGDVLVGERDGDPAGAVCCA